MLAGNNNSSFFIQHDLPVIFRENAGQWDSDILYSGTSVGWNANVYFMNDKLSFGFGRAIEESNTETIDKVVNQHTTSTSYEKMEYLVWEMKFKNSNENSVVSAYGREDSRTNYLLGEDFSKHRVNVNDYRAVEYKNIYNNIDVRYYGTASTLKYDFIVKPGAKPASIQLQCNGIERLHVNEMGELEIKTPWGKLIEKMPESFQIINGKKKLVDVSYVLYDEKTFGFKVNGNYDTSYELIIDPVTLAWSTFVGGVGSTANGYLYDIALDAAGNIYGTGYYGSDFPTTPGVYDPTYGGSNNPDAYVFKLNPTGTALVYCTYLGGSQSDWGWAITVNANGEVYVKGVTRGSFPVTAGAYDVTYNGGLSDMFICKLNATGSGLIYSTYVGGSNQELDINSYENDGIYVNAAGEVFTAGRTWSNDFPTTPGCFDNTYNGGFSDGIILRLNAAGSALVYSTYLGGSGAGHESALGIAVNAANEAYVVGYTNSSDLPVTAGAFQAASGGSTDAFVAKINAAGTALLYCSYIGGTAYDVGSEITVNAAGEAYITGTTGSANFPTTAGAYDVVLGGSGDFFVTKFNTTGTALVFSTFVGGSGGEGGFGIALNSQDEPFVAGGGISADFPATNCAYDQTDNGSAEVMVFKLNASGTRLDYGTYMGGNAKDYYNNTIIVRGPCGKEEVWVSSTVHSANFPTTAGVYQQIKQNSINDQPVVFKFNPPVVVPGFTVTPDVLCNTPASFTDTTDPSCGLWRPIDSWYWDFGDGSTSTLQHPTHAFTGGGTKTVRLILGCYGDTATQTIDVGGGSVDSPGITEEASCEQVLLTASVSNATYLWSTGETTQSILPQQPGVYWVQVDQGGCTSNDTIDVTQTLGSSIVFFPNTFTPNNDNLNEEFFGAGVDITEYKLLIFDRWGNRIFETNNFNHHWDGTFNQNPAQQDVYVWKAQFKVPCLGDQLIEKVGHVTLLR